jgi:hypothetical protein
MDRLAYCLSVAGLMDGLGDSAINEERRFSYKTLAGAWRDLAKQLQEARRGHPIVKSDCVAGSEVDRTNLLGTANRNVTR